jgi:hypothetical protein
MANCPICQMSTESNPRSDANRRWDCTRCSSFRITGTAEQLLDNRRRSFDAENLGKIIRESSRDAEGLVRINEYNLDGFLSRAL